MSAAVLADLAWATHGGVFPSSDFDITFARERAGMLGRSGAGARG